MIDLMSWTLFLSLLVSLGCSDRFWGLHYGTTRYRIVLVTGPLASIALLGIWFYVLSKETAP